MLALLPTCIPGISIMIDDYLPYLLDCCQAQQRISSRYYASAHPCLVRCRGKPHNVPQPRHLGILLCGPLLHKRAVTAPWQRSRSHGLMIAGWPCRIEAPCEEFTSVINGFLFAPTILRRDILEPVADGWLVLASNPLKAGQPRAFE